MFCMAELNRVAEIDRRATSRIIARLNGRAETIRRLAELEAHAAYLESKLSRRKCFACSHTGWYADGRLCEKCGSPYTRIVV